MGQTDFDRLLRQALLEAAKEDAAACPEPERSERYRKNARRMLADPFGYARRARRPAWKKALRTAACLALACLVAFGALMAASPETGARVVRWVRERTQTVDSYSFTGEIDSEEMPEFALAAIPEGFAETERVNMRGFVSICYENESGQIIRFTYMRMEEGKATSIGRVDMEEEAAKVHDCPATFYHSLKPSQSNLLTWIDEEMNIFYSIDMFGEKQDILYIAESVILLN